MLALVFTLGTTTPAPAQVYFAPLIGYDFGGDATCPAITGCTDKKLNAGLGLGRMGALFGFEEEFSYARNFFGEAPALSSSVLTIMTNLMFVPRVGPVRPYALAGLGLMKTHVEFTPASILTSNNTHMAWDIGGGVVVLFSDHVGLRGDIRHFHSFQDLNILFFELNSPKLDFGRASASLMLTF